MKLKFTFLLVFVQVLFFKLSVAQNITTIVGGLGDWGPATSAELNNPGSIAVDRAGNIYIGDIGNAIVRKVDASGTITIYAGIPGTGIYIYTGDGGPAISAIIGQPVGLAVDTMGNLFIADGIDPVVRKVSTAGIITTYAGGGGSSSEGVPATSTRIHPSAIAADNKGNLYIADKTANKVRKVDASGIITTVAGNGTAGFSRDGFAATSAQLNQPLGVCVDKAGNVFIADANNYRVRKIDNTGIITTYAGNGTVGYTGDGVVATSANLNQPVAVTADGMGNIYIADNHNNTIRQVNTSGIITRVAGTYLGSGFSGDGGPATIAQMSNPSGVATDAVGNIYIADYYNNRIRKVNVSGTIATVAGCNYNTDQGHKGDGGPAVSALLHNPYGLVYDTLQNLFFADHGNNCVRKINGAGIISTIAGNDTSGFTGDGGLAIHASLNSPVSAATDRKGNIYICDAGNRRIRKVNNTGIITTYAGNGTSTFSGDGHHADSAGFVSLTGIVIDKLGNLYVSDNLGSRIRKIDTNQIITTIAGNGIAGYYGDGGPASSALVQPYGISVDNSGNLLIADGSYRIRKIDGAGNISTIAGNGTPGITGDSFLAVLAGIGFPQVVSLDKFGNLFFNSGGIIRKVNPAGIISTYAGNGNSAFSGDGGPAILAGMSPSGGLTTDTAGNLLIADASNNRIREIYNASIHISTPHDTICTGFGATFTATVTAAPQHLPYYRWQKNGINVGTNSNIYTAATLNNGDSIVCWITNGPTGPKLAVSNQIDIVVPSGVPSISISSNVGTNLCLGTVANCSASSIINGGASPILDWYKNGIKVFTGTNYIFTPANNDTLRCRLTSSSPCLTPDTAISANLLFTTYFSVPAVSISATPAGPLCLGTRVAIDATITNGGFIPACQWYKNGKFVFNGNPYIDTPVNGDTVYCKITSNAGCVIPDTAISAITVFAIYPPGYPAVTITPYPGDTICPGTSVRIIADGSLEGSGPDYSWYVNSKKVYSGSIYTYNPLNGDQVYCKMTSNSSCILTDTATSGIITFVYAATVPDSVTFSVSPGNAVCAGTEVTCNATSINGGSNPSYAWYKNGSQEAVGDSYNFTPDNGDILYCKLFSSICTSPAPANSDNVYFSVQSSVRPDVTFGVVPDNVLCAGVQVTCTPSADHEGVTPTYTWYQNGNNVFTGQQYSFTPVDGDQLYCQLESSAECATPQTVKSGTLTFRIDSIPTVTITCNPSDVNFRGTTVTFTANVPGGSGNSQFQWLQNGTPIPGATSDVYSSSDFSFWDSIKCQVIFTGACNATVMSNTLVVDTYHGMRLYPDPNHGDFVINGNNYEANGDPVKIRIFNSTGKLVYEKDAAFDAITFYTEINMGRQMPPGVYSLHLVYDHDNVSFLFVIKD